MSKDLIVHDLEAVQVQQAHESEPSPVLDTPDADLLTEELDPEEEEDVLGQDGQPLQDEFGMPVRRKKPKVNQKDEQKKLTQEEKAQLAKEQLIKDREEEQDFCYQASPRCFVAFAAIILFLSCFLGPVTLAIGMYELVIPIDGTRGTKIRSYISAAETWQHTHLDTFSNALFYWGANSADQVIPMSTSFDTLADKPKYGEKFVLYDSLKYSVRKSNVFSSIFSTKSTEKLFLYAAPSSNAVASLLTPQIQIPLFVLGTIEFKESLSASIKQTKCDMVKGYLSEGICQTYWKLNETCVKVGISGSTVSFDNSFGGYGCAPTQLELRNLLEEWTPGRYVPIDARTGPPVGSQSISINATIRSAADPWILANHLTDGSLYFGRQFLRNMDGGQILAIFGGVLSAGLAPIIFFVSSVTRRAKLYRGWKQFAAYVEEKMKPAPSKKKKDDSADYDNDEFEHDDKNDEENQAMSVESLRDALDRDDEDAEDQQAGHTTPGGEAISGDAAEDHNQQSASAGQARSQFALRPPSAPRAGVPTPRPPSGGPRPPSSGPVRRLSSASTPSWAASE